MSGLLDDYKKEFLPQLKADLAVGNDLAVPRLTKIVVTMGTGTPAQDKNRLAAAAADLAMITGQKPQTCRARQSVSNFKLRKGMAVGCRVTLRGRRMYEFVQRLFNAAIPRLRDFRGLDPRSFDGRGNYSFGVPDQSIFPEVDPTKITYNQGMNITLVTTAEDDRGASALLTKLGMPFRGMEVQSS